MIAKFFKRRLTSCLCFVVAAACILSSLPLGIAGNGYQVSAADGQPERNWAQGASYVMEYSAHHNYDDPDGTKLTDGVYATDYTDDLLVFATRFGTTSIVMDLGYARDVNRIVISGFEKDSYGIGPATDVVIEYLDEATGEWEQAAAWQNSQHFTGNDDDGLGVGYGIYEEEAEVSFKASQIRFSINMENGWLAYNEIEVWGPVDENTPSIPVLEENLLSEIIAPIGSDVDLSVSLAPMEYGEGDITYEWY